MKNKGLSRRSFLTQAAVSGAAFSLSPVSGLAGILAEAPLNNRPKVYKERLKVVCTEELSESEAEKIKSSAPNVDLILEGKLKEKSLFEDADGVLGWINADVLPVAKQLKWVQTWAAGVENMPREFLNYPFTLTNMQRVYAPVIAETAIALLLSLTRGLAQVSIPNFREKKWGGNFNEVLLDNLYGKTIGIVGMGGIGSETARRLHYGFGMKVLATDAKPLAKPDFVEELREPAWLQEMAAKVDVLMSAAPLTSETRGIFNQQIFSKLKPTAYFINVSRGGLVNQDDLVRALKTKQISGAGLDVTTPEPLPPSDALWNCPNLVITPHNSGNAPVRRTRLIDLVTENVRRFSSGLPLMNVVDKAKGY